MKSIKKQYKTPISKNVYDDIRGKLKYLFWIDIDELIKDIKNSEEYSDFQKAPSNDLKKLEKLFEKLFDKIFKYCDNYTKFLDNPGCCQLFFDYDTLHPLDGTPPTDKKGIYNYNIFFLFKEALKNHLIIHSFLSFTNESNQKKYSLSFKNELELQKALDGKKFSIAYNQDHNNFFTRRKKRYHDDSENLLYSHQILNDICQVNDDSTFETNTCFKNWAYYCYATKSVLNLDTSICNIRSDLTRNLSGNFFKYYRQLYLHTSFFTAVTDSPTSNYNVPNSNNTPKEFEKNFAPDSEMNGSSKILFRYPAEWYYGFATSDYIYRILEACYDRSSIQLNLLTLKSLLNNDFLKTLSKVYSLPNVFSRHFFLKYACTAALQSKTLKFEYLEPSHRSMILVDKQAHTITNASGLVSRIDNFITMLKEITIPVLEACWDVVISEILPSNLTGFTSYVNLHYDELISDYTHIPDEILERKDITEDITGYPKASFVDLLHQSKISKDYVNALFKKTLPCNDLLSILMDYYNSPSTTISPEDDILDFQVPGHQRNYSSSKRDLLQDLQTRHIRNLFEYYVQAFDTRTLS